MLDDRIKAREPFSDETISALEGELGRSVPNDYKSFVKQYGGPFIGGSLDGNSKYSILRFFGINGDSGIFSKMKWHLDLVKDGALPIADCEVGNIYVINASDEIFYIDYYSGTAKIEKVSDSFSEFIEKIVVED